MAASRSAESSESYSQSSEEPPDKLSNVPENSPREKNAWLQLKTITTFDSGNEGTANLSPPQAELELTSNKHTCSHKDDVCVFQRKTHMHSVESSMEVNDLFNAHQDLNPSDLYPRTRHSRNVEGGHAIFRAPVRHRRRQRSRSNSLSDGDIPYGAVGDPVSHFSVSSSPPRNGTVSDRGVDRTNTSLGSCSAAPVQSFTRFSPTSLLVESLIDQLCRLLEKDSGKQKKLYHVICERLHQMQLIDDTYTIEEFQFMRSHYQKSLFQLLAVAKSSTQSPGARNILLPLPSSNMNVDLKMSSEKIFNSRYYHEYQEIEFLAKGGFGHVYKVRNKLDGGEYAIKKINLRYRYVEGFLRSLKEVKMLARLNHPNIVSYKAAWLEPLDDDKKKTAIQRTAQRSTSQEGSISILSIHSNLKLPPPSCSKNMTEDSLDIVFQESSSDNGCKSSKGPILSECNMKEQSGKRSLDRISDALGASILPSSGTSPEFSSHPSSCVESDSSKSSAEGAMCPVKCNDVKRGSQSSSVVRNWATLYVQMQLCERTLRQWLDERNVLLPSHPLSPDSREGMLALNLFRQIVRGVDYIHTQGIVHHDIKPSNIFVNSNFKEVQVGDFGLSCCILSRVDSTGVVGEHHGEVGTRLYAAPEQLRGRCTPKSDVYSLGIVFLELLQPFHTDMERSKVIQKLRSGQLPPELTGTWPLAARLISDLLVVSSAARPTASDLLQRVDSLLCASSKIDLSSQLALKDETIRLLQEAVASRDQEIAELRRRLSLVTKE